jgi:hypothetical protein
MRKRIWRRVTGKLTVGLAKHVSTVCIALSVGGHVAFASHAQGRWGRASPGGKLKCWNAGNGNCFLHSMKVID